MFPESESFLSAICSESGILIRGLVVSDLEAVNYLIYSVKWLW